MTTGTDIVAVRHYTRSKGARLAYRFVEGAGPLLVFLPGYGSDMEGGKAQAVLADARAKGRACLLLDYAGCGSSEGAFEDGTLTSWRDDALTLIAHVWPEGDVLPVGSSMGGWIALLVALALADRTAAVLGIAAAPDFTRWSVTEDRRAELHAHGRVVEPSDYGGDQVMTLAFWQSGEANLLLDGTIPLDCPVRFLHGQADDVVPWQIAVRAGAALRSPDVRITLVKDGDHRLSRESDIALLLSMLDDLIGAVQSR